MENTVMVMFPNQFLNKILMMFNLSCVSKEPGRSPNWLIRDTTNNIFLFIWEAYTILRSGHKWKYCRLECDSVFWLIFADGGTCCLHIRSKRVFPENEVERSFETSVEIYRTILTTAGTLTLTKYWNLLNPLDRKR